MRLNPLTFLYWACRLVGVIWRRVTLRLATIMHHATLRSVGRHSRFQYGVRFDNPGTVTVGADCYFWRGCMASSELPKAKLVIGDRVQINLNVQLDVTGGMQIGDDVLISQDVVIYTHDHGLDPRAAPQAYPKVIGPDVWIGMRAVILPQCQQIGRGAVVAAGAIVTRDVPAYAVVAGNPARVIRQRAPAHEVAA